MKRRRVLLLTLSVLALCVACGWWLHKERQQYALNRQLIAALQRDDPKTALALVNEGANPNTSTALLPPPALKFSLRQFLYHTSLPGDESPTAFMFACGLIWESPMTKHPLPVTVDENLPLLQSMIVHNANVHAHDERNRTALFYAVSQNRFSTVELLLKHDVDVNQPDTTGMTPLHWTTMNNASAMMRLLLSYGGAANTVFDGYGTPLHIAVKWNDSKDIIQQLLAHGADPKRPDREGLTPLEWAKRMKRPDLVRLLKRGAK